jgi:Type IIA topoisomerase (DNA gyrase/topo II, topoisomerase IV), A subunit
VSQKAYLEFFIMFAMDSKRRLYYNRLRKVKTSIHETDAFIKAIESDYIDEIVSKIRKRKEINDKEFVEWLIKVLKITDLQAEYIINARLKYLSQGYLAKFKADADSLRNKEEMYTRFITDDNLIKQEIKNRSY